VHVEHLTPEKACLKLKPEFGWGLMKPFTVPLSKIRAQTLVDGPYLNRAYNDFGAGVGNQVKRNYKFDRKAFFEEADNYIFGIGGVLTDPKSDRGKKVTANINALIDAGKRVIFVTNDSRHERSQVFNRLTTQFGIGLERQSLGPDSENLTPAEKQKRLERNVVTAAHTCGWYLVQANIQRPFLICSEPGLLFELEAAGIHDYVATIDKSGKRLPEFCQSVTPENIMTVVRMAVDCDAVVVGWDHDPTHITLTAAVQLLRWNEELKKRGEGNGMLLVSCSMDQAGTLGGASSSGCYPFDNMKFRISGNGVLTRSICYVVGMDIQPINLGKPSLLLMEMMRRREEDKGLGLDFNRTVIIGESLDSDITLANKAGIRSLLVLSGYTSRVDVEQAEEEEENVEKLPTWILDDFASFS